MASVVVIVVRVRGAPPGPSPHSRLTTAEGAIESMRKPENPCRNAILGFRVWGFRV